jgi:hypothetical protein
MKIFSCTLLLMASLAFVLVGCSDKSSTLVTPSDQTIAASSSPASLSKGALVASASGNAQLYLDLDGNATAERSDVLRVYTFSAREYADGSYSGEITTLGAPYKQWDFKATVTQLKVQGNKAKMIIRPYKAGGLAAGIEDYYICHLVIDNGEGSKAEFPDMSTIWWSFEPSELPYFMGLSPDGFLGFLGQQQLGFDYLIPNVVGNVQVRGSSY